jgi:anti-sigma factor RsiW
MDLGNEITCKQLVELVTEYLEGALPPSERGRFEAHLDGCEGCRVYLDQMRETIAATGSLGRETLSDEAFEELCRTVRSWLRVEHPRPASDGG